MSTVDEVLNKRSAEFGMPSRGGDVSHWPYFLSFIPYPYQYASAVDNSGFQGPTLGQALGPDGILIPAGGAPVTIPVPLARDANYFLESIRYAAYRDRGPDCVCEGSEAAVLSENLAGILTGMTIDPGEDGVCDMEFEVRLTFEAGDPPQYTIGLYLDNVQVAVAAGFFWQAGSTATLTEVNGSGMSGDITMVGPDPEAVTGTATICPNQNPVTLGALDYLVAPATFMATPGRSSFHTAQDYQRIPWNENIEVTVYLQSGGDRDYYGGMAWTAVSRLMQEIPLTLTALQSRDSGPGELEIAALLGKNTTVIIKARNIGTQDLRLNGTLIGYKVA